VNDFFRKREKLKRETERLLQTAFTSPPSPGRIICRRSSWSGPITIIIGSDFDHGDAISTWPNTVAPIKAMKEVSESDKEKILGGNAARLFGMKG
jgi:predicted TIM-barrel fold metal-dependent hydrolase